MSTFSSTYHNDKTGGSRWWTAGWRPLAIAGVAVGSGGVGEAFPGAGLAVLAACWHASGMLCNQTAETTVRLEDAQRPIALLEKLPQCAQPTAG